MAISSKRKQFFLPQPKGEGIESLCVECRVRNLKPLPPFFKPLSFFLKKKQNQTKMTPPRPQPNTGADPGGLLRRQRCFFFVSRQAGRRLVAAGLLPGTLPAAAAGATKKTSSAFFFLLRESLSPGPSTSPPPSPRHLTPAGSRTSERGT